MPTCMHAICGRCKHWYDNGVFCSHLCLLPCSNHAQEVSEVPKVYGPSNFDDSIYQKSYMDVCDTLSMSMDQVGNMAGPEIGYI